MSIWQSVSQTYLLEAAVGLLVLLLLPYVVGALWRQWRIYYAFRSVPCEPDMHFLFGHVPKVFRSDGHGANLFWYRGLVLKYGWKSFRVSVGPLFDNLLCVHPDTAQEILKNDPKVDLIYNPLKPFIGDGLLVSSGRKWAGTRRLLTPAFHYDILRPYVPIYASAASVLTDQWAKVPEGEAFDVFPYISLLTLDVVLRCSCSHESNCQVTGTHNEYVAAIYKIANLTMERVVWFPGYYDFIYMMTPSYWRFRRACQTVHKFSMDTIKKRRAALEENAGNGRDTSKGAKGKYLDFLDILLKARDEKGIGMSDKEIRDEVDTFMFEGHDTTASGIAWTLYNLAKYPEHQEKCRQEVDAIFDQKEAMDWEDLKSLEYVKYCIKESMRLFPPVPIVGRTLDKDTKVDGRLMPKGTPVFCNMHAIHHNPDAWEDPEEYNPLRFAADNSKDRHSHAYLTFSAGPRNCIGQEFALNEEKVVIAHILRRFELSLDETRPPEEDYFVVLRPKPLFLKLKHREC